MNSKKIHLTVNNFIKYKDRILFLKRDLSKKWDPGKLNGVGGKLEPGEDFLTGNKRETFEETGYELKDENIGFFGLMRIETPDEEWISAVFTSNVDSEIIPRGNITEDGEFVWLNTRDIKEKKSEFVSDLEYYFEDIFNLNKRLFILVKYDSEGNFVSVSKEYLG